jgi:hypothetical protein
LFCLANVLRVAQLDETGSVKDNLIGRPLPLEIPNIAERNPSLPKYFSPPKRNDEQFKIDDDQCSKDDNDGSSVIDIEHKFDDISSHPSLKTMRRSNGGAKTFDFVFEEPIPISKGPSTAPMSRLTSGNDDDDDYDDVYLK